MMTFRNKNSSALGLLEISQKIRAIYRSQRKIHFYNFSVTNMQNTETLMLFLFKPENSFVLIFLVRTVCPEWLENERSSPQMQFTSSNGAKNAFLARRLGRLG